MDVDFKAVSKFCKNYYNPLRNVEMRARKPPM